jgi:hypothetical protein
MAHREKANIKKCARSSKMHAVNLDMVDIKAYPDDCIADYYEQSVTEEKTHNYALLFET